ncbi:MAG: DUF192 domain-containing protein, partial [Egibacteraceae bacterium]
NATPENATPENATPENATPENATPATDLAPMPPFGTAQVILVGPEDERVEMAVYVADDPDTRRQGLMGVTDLPREAGMIFLTDEDRDTGFWMKDTLLPLSIAYLAADGTVVSVLDMEPCEADPCPSYPPGARYRHALEVHQGRFAEVGLQEGWRVDLPTDAAPR